MSGVNEVGDLPTESILRVDILPEEVALRYGYGAQQKVVNIILRRYFRAKLFDLTGSESTDGGGESDMADANYSRIHDNDRVNVVARVQTQEPILESDRGVSSTAATVSDPTGSIGNDSDARTLEPGHKYVFTEWRLRLRAVAGLARVVQRQGDLSSHERERRLSGCHFGRTGGHAVLEEDVER